MVYNQNFVAVIKCNGKILREVGDSVTLPFGSEYSILLKNLGTRTAVADISIDGKSVMDGHLVIVPPNQDVEIEGFVDGLKTTNKFKFIEKTDQISDHRGDKIDDGMVRVEYTFEKEVIQKTILYETHHHHDVYHPHWYPYWSPVRSYTTAGSSTNQMIGGGTYTASCNNVGETKLGNFSDTQNCFSAQVSLDSMELNSEKNEDGITVAGSESDQTFYTGWTGELEDSSHVICLKLKGGTPEKRVSKPVTVKTKVICPTCGKKSKAGIKFCSNCGTALVKF